MTDDEPGAASQLWAGAECTIVRVGDDYRDQAVETGHHDRLDDIDLFAELGVETVRFPILWERIAPERPDRLDFGWTDERLERLRERGIEVDRRPAPPRLRARSTPACSIRTSRPSSAEYAARVAERYPWIEHWTPVNEPLTTARFSGLYGHWYPHRRDYPAFLRALVNQCRGTLEAMRAIRSRHPEARARPDRGSRQDLLDPAAALPGGARE